MCKQLCLTLPYPVKGERRQRKCWQLRRELCREHSKYRYICRYMYMQIYMQVSGNICADLGIYPSLMFHIARRAVAFKTGAEVEAHLKMPIKKFNLIPKTEAEPMPPLCCSPSSPPRLPSQYSWWQTKSKRICQRFLHLNFRFKFNLQHLPPFVAHQTVHCTRGGECGGVGKGY